jgi:putative chitinase
VEIENLITADFLRRALPGIRDAEGWRKPLVVACHRYGISNARRIAAFIAQAGHESADFCRLVESLNYSPERLLAVFPRRITRDLAYALGRIQSEGQPADEEGIAELVYGRRSDLGNILAGDGFAFRGVGIFQVTGRYNHTMVAQEFAMAVDDVSAWCRTPEGASLSAAHYWATRELSVLADRGRFDEICCRINGAQKVSAVIGLTERRARHARALALLERAAVPA